MPKLKVEQYPVFAINIPVRVVAAGGMSGDWYGALALTGATTKKGGYSHTVIKALSPNTGELVQMPWRSDFLEAVREEEELEKIEELKCAIHKSKKLLQCVTSSPDLAEPQSLATNSESKPRNLLNPENKQVIIDTKTLPQDLCQNISQNSLLPTGNCMSRDSIVPKLPDNTELHSSQSTVSLSDTTTNSTKSLKSNSLSSMAKSMPLINADTIPAQVGEIENPLPPYIETSGSFITEQYQAEKSSITSTETSSTIESKTWNASQSATTLESINRRSDLAVEPSDDSTQDLYIQQSQMQLNPLDCASMPFLAQSEKNIEQQERTGNTSSHIKQKLKTKKAIINQSTVDPSLDLIPEKSISQSRQQVKLLDEQHKTLEQLSSPKQNRQEFIGNTNKCLDTSICFQGLEDLPLQPTSLEDLKQLNSLKSQKTQKQYCDRVIPLSLFTQISETIIQPRENLIYSPLDFPAQVHQTPEPEPDSTILNQPSGEKPYDVSVSGNPDSSLWNSLKDLSNEDFEQSLEDSEWQAIVSTIRSSYQQRNSEPCTNETEFLSCPTLTSGSKTEKSRAAGTTKCEKWFKEQGLIPDGCQLSAPAMAVLMDLPEDLFDPLCPPSVVQKAEYAPATLPDEQSAQPKHPSLLEEFSTSIVLSDDEGRDLHRLEIKVERAFYEAGSALREIRDRRLYRDKYKTFEEYCKERFGFTRRSCDYKIGAAAVFENLLTNGEQKSTEDNLRTNGSQIMPTSERQVRDLINLEPDEQRQIWSEAVERAGGKVPTGTAVKGIVERIRERDNTPPCPEYKEGDVVEIRSGGSSTLRKHDGMWGIITHVGTWSYKVYVSLRDVELQCKGNELNRVDEKYTEDIKAVSDRIARLQKCDLDPIDDAAIEILARRTCFTERQKAVLSRLEVDYGILGNT